MPGLYVALRLLRGEAVEPVQGMRVLVAGAGLAGLCAARELAAAGCAVTMLDARDRLGGRVRTLRDGLPDGAHAELGGEFIDGEHKEIRALADGFELPLIRVLTHGFTHRFRGDDGAPHVSRTGPWDALREQLAPLISRFEAARGSSDADAVRELSSFSLREWLRRQQAPASVHAMADAIRGFFLADADELSVLPVIEQLESAGSPAQAEMYRIAGGNDRLIEALHRATPARLLLRTTLRAITQAPDRVVAHVDDQDGHRQAIEGDAIVVTLPASTLCEVDIRPPLPEDQQRAIRRLSYGRATKAIVATPVDIFGGRRARAFATDGPAGAFWDATDGEPGAPDGVVTYLAGGSASRELRMLAASGGDRLLAAHCWLRPAQARSPALRRGLAIARQRRATAGRSAALGSHGQVVAWLSWETDP